jgi:hypothetical protein
MKHKAIINLTDEYLLKQYKQGDGSPLGVMKFHLVLTTTPTLTQKLLSLQNIMQLRNSLIKHLLLWTL